ncbi:MAG: VWA domain-containing protein, partial [Myxococcales bacterium]|nr:VWA domain-containing protein [Myxococcales bacterium]
DTTDTTDTGEMCDDQTDVVLYLSPDDSNSMSSPVQVRQRVLADNSQTLSGINVRTWEFMNYYGFDYPEAADGELALYSAMQLVEGMDTRWRMQIAVSSEMMTPDERPAMNVTLVLDTSGSMAGAPINLLKESCRAIAAQLRQGDTVSMVEWDTQNTWTLAGYPVSGPDDPMLLQKINAVTAGGGTDLNGGLTSGYELAQSVFDANMLNRLVLISDGGANAGVTDIAIIADNAAYGGSDGIYLVGVGVDDDSSYNDELMDVVTDAGKGASVFVPSNDEAWKVFGDDFEATMAIAARNVQVELTMPPGFEIVKFSGEEFSGDPKEV